MSDLKRKLGKMRKAVWAEIDPAKMREYCIADEKDLYAIGEKHDTKDGPYIHIANGSGVLGVAHLDSVESGDMFHYAAPTKGEHKGFEYAFSPTLDDRLGVYVLLDLLPRLGIKIDVLLTTGEEKSRSTAAYFNPTQNYNWMFQFDRTGDDVVMYQFDCKSSRNALSRFGFRPGEGSFSDIAWLDHLGVLGFNFGTGYYDYHSINAYANINELVEQVARFVLFFKEYADKLMPFDSEAWIAGYGAKSNWKGVRYSRKGWSRYDQWEREVSDPYDEGRLRDEWREDYKQSTGHGLIDHQSVMWATLDGRVTVSGRVEGTHSRFNCSLSDVKPFLSAEQYAQLTGTPPVVIDVDIAMMDIFDAAHDTSFNLVGGTQSKEIGPQS